MLSKTPREVWDGRLFCLALVAFGAFLHYLYPSAKGTPGVILDIVKLCCCAFGAIALLASFVPTRTKPSSTETTPEFDFVSSPKSDAKLDTKQDHPQKAKDTTLFKVGMALTGAGKALASLSILAVIVIIAAFALKPSSDSQKMSALDLDKQVYQQVQDSEKAYKLLLSALSLAEEGVITQEKLLDTAETTKTEQERIHTKLIELADERAEEYLHAARIYVTNAKGYAEDLINYINQPDDIYLASAYTRTEAVTRYVLDVASLRIEFLADQGYSDDEIFEIVAPDNHQG